MAGFQTLEFEVKMPTGLGGTAPHLDAVALGTSNVVAIESKATEYLQQHGTLFADSYRGAQWPSCIEPYITIMRDLKSNPSRFVYLDAAQLVKHACGLSRRFGNQEVILLYLFWEPRNHHEYDAFQHHRDEAETFAKMSVGSTVTFVWRSYLDLWLDWSRHREEWARAHSRILNERYVMQV